MANENLKLKELGVRVEAMFEWPGPSDGTSPLTMTEAAAEIGERLQALEQRLSPVAKPEAPPQIVAATPEVPRLSDPSQAGSSEAAQVTRLLEMLEQRLEAPSQPGNEIVSVARRLSALEEQLANASASSELAQVTRLLEILEQRLDKPSLSTDDVTALAGRLDALEDLETADPNRTDVIELVGRLGALEQRLDDAQPSVDDIASLMRRLDALDQRISESAGVGGGLDGRVGALEELSSSAATSVEMEVLSGRVHELDQRFDKAQAVLADLGALAARVASLEEQLSEFSERPAHGAAVSASVGAPSHARSVPFEHDEALRAAATGPRHGVSSPPETGVGPEPPGSEDQSLESAGQLNSVVVPGVRESVDQPVLSGSTSSSQAVVERPPASDDAGLGNHSPYQALLPSAVSVNEVADAVPPPADEADVLELLRKEIASLHTEFGPLTMAPDSTYENKTAPAAPAPAGGSRRFKKGLRRGEPDL